MKWSSEQLSDRLCRHVAESRFEQLPLTSREAACRAVLDATGVMCAASGLSPDIRPFVEIARAGAGGGNCSILGFGDGVSAAMAAFANGAMAHALDFEDAFDLAPCHPNAASIPSAIAIAQSVAPIHGRDLVTAVAVGCDLVCRLGLSLRQSLEQNGWYPPPILGAFGATAVVARMLRLDPLQTRDALSLALCQATAPGEIKHSAGTVIRAVREAFPAQAAVLSGLLARGGVKGFEAPLEGKAGFFRLYADGHFDPRDLLENLGSYFHVDRLSFKPWPACRGTHAFIEMARDLAAKNRIDWREIDSVKLLTAPLHRMLLEPGERKRAPLNVIDAKFSIPFTVALALVHGDVSLALFSEDALGDGDVLDLARRVHAREQPEWGADKAATGALEIVLRDGRVFRMHVEQALGHPDAPLSTTHLIEKFLDCCGHANAAIESGVAREAADRILNLSQEPDSGTVFRFSTKA